ncbi:cytidine deaminase [Sciscionella marina]|uniref:cytidine deaminase n=1 Tax=Sciscionella marina TaxID=508770 RepID=UPI0003826953|nr:cytidine deaminase [Sciscionella marina]
MAEIDWELLRAKAIEATARSYAPYSGLAVGAAALVGDGRIITGCNVENASYGLALCAECTLVGQLRMTGGGRLTAFACRGGEGQLLMPCGRCRQLLYEHGGPDCLVDAPDGIVTVAGILPYAFGPEHLPE